MQIFYAPNITGNKYTLTEEESKHCIKVLRMSVGAEITLIDGKGNLYTATISNPNSKSCEVEVTNVQAEYGKRDFYLHIAIAPTKNIERFEWFLEKATEIGIDEITPILCERSERKSIKNDRLEKIIISAVKQSIKAYVPKLNEMVPLKQFLTKSFNGQKFIAHCNSWDLPPLKDQVKPNSKITILIGPEGDFSPDEVELSIQNDFSEISLGTSRLRTETAGVVACHTVNLKN
ncbi:MAG TPA: 16S rRNA (uracil(1498)-N(3))-methyltransferase [Tenuifilaceae bacterium]|nr:16S rRNA (uracil(1498)-N(3))-methyltransferase [Tenuifilaceae bacterium]